MNTYETIPSLDVRSPYDMVVSLYASELTELDQPEILVSFDIFGRKLNEVIDEPKDYGLWMEYGGLEDCLVLKPSSTTAAIHHRFAGIELDSASTFAAFRKWGPLNLRFYWLPLDKDDPTPPEVINSSNRYFEPVSDWIDQILRMRLLISLLSIARSLSTYEYQDAMHQAKEHVREVRCWQDSISHPEFDFRTAAYLADTWEFLSQEAKDPNKIREAAQEVLTSSVNVILSFRCQPFVRCVQGAHIEIRTNDILGAVYASLATESLGRVSKAKVCQGCGKWFISVHGRQAHCSDSCKTKAYRRRQQAKKEDNNA